MGGLRRGAPSRGSEHENSQGGAEVGLQKMGSAASRKLPNGGERWTAYGEVYLEGKMKCIG